MNESPRALGNGWSKKLRAQFVAGILVVVLIYLAGVIARNVVGKKLVHYGDSVLTKVPVFRQLYTGIR